MDASVDYDKGEFEEARAKGMKYIISRTHSKIRSFSRRIVAVKDFADVKSGDAGGYVDGEQNLSQDGDCWLYGDSMSVDNAFVDDNAKLRDGAVVCGIASVYGNAELSSSTVMHGSVVCGNAKVSSNSLIRRRGFVCENAEIVGSTVEGTACVGGNARLDEGTVAKGDAVIRGSYVFRRTSVCTGKYE